MRETFSIKNSGMMAALFLVALLCVLPGAALGHAFPDHSDPKVGAILAVSPDRVRIWFDSDLEPVSATIMVHNKAGALVDNKDGRVDSSDTKLLEVSLPHLSPGTYSVNWSVVSKEGHRSEGEYTFVIK